MLGGKPKHDLDLAILVFLLCLLSFLAPSSECQVESSLPLLWNQISLWPWETGLPDLTMALNLLLVPQPDGPDMQSSG